MGRVVLTDRTVKAKKAAAKGKRDVFNDALVPGMALRVTDTGHKSYVLMARFPLNPSAPTYRTLGSCYIPAKENDAELSPTLPAIEIRNGALTLSEARAKAREWLDLIARGKDPKIEEGRQKVVEQRKQSNSFAAVAQEYIARHIKGPSLVEMERQAGELREKEPKLTETKALAKVMADPKNRDLVAKSKKEGIVKKGEAERIIDNEFVKRWGIRPITDILPEDASFAIRAIVKRGSPYQAHNTFGYLRGLFNWAIGTGEFGLTVSPVERLQPAKLIGKKEARDRTLAEDELRLVWAAADAMGYPYGPIIKLLILTGQRELEIAEMSWSEIDLANKMLTVPGQRMKMDRAHEVPLCPEAIALIETLPRWAKGDFVFTTTDGEKPVNGFSKAKTRLDRLISEARAKARTGEEKPKIKDEDFISKWVFHDLRRSVRTHFSALPVQDMVRELVIAHAKPGLHKVYDLHAYQDEKRQCLALWEARLKGILNPPPAGIARLDEARNKTKNPGNLVKLHG